MKKISSKYIWLLITIPISLLFGCSVFMEEDISDDLVTLIAPADNDSTEIVTLTFWWNKNNDATSYRLQIVSPDFASATSVVLDTLVVEDKYDVTLFPGDFEWRVRAENGAYQTDWTTAKLTIIATDDLTQQRVRLVIPNENSFTNKQNITFKWDTLPHVDFYKFLIYKDDWGNGDSLEDQKVEDGNSITLDVDEEELWWGVRAVNSKSTTLFTYRKLIVDVTPPLVPTLGSPGDNHSSADTTVTFAWTKGSDVNWKNDSVFVYEKTNGTSTELFEAKESNNQKATFDLDEGKSYTWKVKSIDKANNVGEFSEERTIKIE